MNRRTAAGIAVVLGALAVMESAAAAASLPADETVRALVRAALVAPDGRAQGVWRGPGADALAALSPAPLTIAVTTIAPLPSGCARLAVRFAQDAVRLGSTAPAPRAVTFFMTACRDGGPPPAGP